VDALNVLALEPYYGGSHRAFLDVWRAASRHHWQLLSLPARHWKWRMRGSALWLADQIGKGQKPPCDVILTCDLTSVADLRALMPAAYDAVPIVAYFHENQLTYPLAPDDWRDYQYAFTNLTSALAADALWFNSHAHLDAFVAAVGGLLEQMPDFVVDDLPAEIGRRAEVHYPAVESGAGTQCPSQAIRGRRLRILWCHRWEFDKDPETFFETIATVQAAGADFELVMVGEQFRTAPAVFAQAQEAHADRIVHAGYLPDRAAYWRMIATCDVVVSTAIQENFGIAVVEAMLAGCVPLLPNRLSYPEILPDAFHAACIYATPDQLAQRLMQAAAGRPILRPEERQMLIDELAARFGASAQIPRLDDALRGAVSRGRRQAGNRSG